MTCGRMLCRHPLYFHIFPRQNKISTNLKAIPMKMIAVLQHPHQHQLIRVIMMLIMQMMEKLMIEMLMIKMILGMDLQWFRFHDACLIRWRNASWKFQQLNDLSTSKSDAPIPMNETYFIVKFGPNGITMKWCADRSHYNLNCASFSLKVPT